MPLTYYLDEDISRHVAEGSRHIGIDAISVHEIGRANKRIPDEDQLIAATAEGRVLVTYNRADFQILDAQWRAAGRSHSGILWCTEKSIPRRAIGDLIRALESLAHQYEALTDICMPLPRPPL